MTGLIFEHPFAEYLMLAVLSEQHFGQYRQQRNGRLYVRK